MKFQLVEEEKSHKYIWGRNQLIVTVSIVFGYYYVSRFSDIWNNSTKKVKQGLFVLTLLFLVSSCCAPYQYSYVDPLMGERVTISKHCLCSPCPPEAENCAYRPLLNIEYERNTENLFKIGPVWPAYAPHFMLTGGINYLHNQDHDKGFGLDGQLGFFPVNYMHTTFVGLEYKRLFGEKEQQLLSPNLGISIPVKHLSSFQFKVGYNFGFNDPTFTGPYGAINLKVPFFHLF